MLLNSAASNFTEKDSNRKINIAEATAATMHHKSPVLIAPPSVDKKKVPVSAKAAESHVTPGIFLANNTAAKKGTNLTLR